MAGPQLPHQIEALLSPEAYPHPVDRVELRQTHISFLLFAGDFVYKVKKPLDLGFLDFTTLAKRERYCHAEVRLNRRLCEETYLGTASVTSDRGRIRIDGEGEVIDYAVKMRRLPDDGMMTPLLERGAVTDGMIAMLARRIAAFHLESERNPEIDKYGGLETAMGNWRENFEQTEPFIGRTITHTQFDEVRSFIEATATADAGIFSLRVEEGRARDCHGDLRADAVCFVEDGVCIFDCIEFNERFRFSDVASDIAFLAMDLEDRGRQDLSDALMTNYLGVTLDGTLPLMLPFYKCYRAYVRGKVDGFQLDQPEVAEEQKSRATESARKAFALAHRYATARSPAVAIVMVGVTGSGKSYLANALAARIGAFVTSSDALRKRLAGVEATERHIEPLNQGIYAPEMTERTYDRLLQEARDWLARGKPVVLDASYLQRKHRGAASRLARGLGVPFLAVECEAGESAVWERLSERRGGERVVSDGRWEIYRAQQERREPVDDLAVGSHMVVQTETPLRDQVDAVLSHVEAARS